MKWTRIFINVSIGAVVGMLMGGAFGFGAGTLTPNFFMHLIPWTDIEPRGIAIVLGAIAGVVLGGGLATFGMVIQTYLEHKKS